MIVKLFAISTIFSNSKVVYVAIWINNTALNFKIEYSNLVY